MFCKKCGHERTGNEKFCPVCGTPYPKVEESTTAPASSENETKVQDNSSQPQFCKKCGTKQEPGQKFCPVCGEPYLDENGKPYPKGMRKDIIETKGKILSTVDNMSEKGKDTSKKIAKKMVVAKDSLNQSAKRLKPMLSEGSDKIETVKKEFKDKGAKTVVKEFLDNSDKTALWGRIIAVAATIAFFIFKAGFHASWMWLICIVAMLVLAFYPQKHIKSSKKQFVGVALLAFCVLLVGPGNGSRDYDSGASYNNEESSDGESDNSYQAYQADVDKLKEEIEAQSEVVEQLEPTYSAILQQAGGLMIATQTNPSICEKFRDEVNKYEDLCSQAATLCDKNGDHEQAQYFSLNYS